MKNLTSIALFLIAISVSAQSKHVTVSGTHFTQGVDSKKWSNDTNEASTSAKFKEYSGESYITFVSDANVKLLFDYVLALTKGEGEIVFSGNGEERHVATLALGSNGKGVNTDKKTFELEAGKEYRLVFKGKNAKGMFKCKWTETGRELTLDN
ncbi:MAG: hypothetical protein EOO50_11555 [Flavobacterium sp.]|uniref:hypothetical protein n=1 Tax=Flavobacterium sp. TaxID=239 RepID=UPI0011FB2322|nr:hypothetical protein [Flavobacterium sp.]RZJ66040.1 MAG: hypothetical protein EOO50_11555 [Flavobacterium sp.]